MLKVMKLSTDGAMSEENFMVLVKDLETRLTDWYSLGDDSFKIDHGENYFDFFHRLGKLKYYAMLDVSKFQIVGVGAGILREIAEQKIWYLCDLRVDSAYRKQNIPLQLFTYALFPNCFISTKAYMVCMDNSADQVWHIIQKFTEKMPSYLSYLKPKKGPSLSIYSLNYKEMLVAQPILELYRKKMSYLSIAGKKDLILKSNNEKINLLHVQSGVTAQHTDILKPVENATHMFCCTELDASVIHLEKLGITTKIKATVLHFGMEDYDFKFILTSDI